MSSSDKYKLKLQKEEKLFYLKETNHIIVLNAKTKYWDNFHIKRLAEYMKKKFVYGISTMNMN